MIEEASSSSVGRGTYVLDMYGRHWMSSSSQHLDL